jgi:putative nucleotidyltransferase with HDIG domain
MSVAAPAPCAVAHPREIVTDDSTSSPEQPGSDLDFLPPSFEILPRLLLLLDDPETNSEAVADLIAVDAGLTADVLRLANMAYFAGSIRVETVQEAIIRLGLREIYRTVMRVVASPVLNSQQKGLERLQLWKHSLACALASRTLAQHNGDDAEVAYTAGLLHDLGKVLLARSVGDPYIALLDECKKNGRTFWTAEKTAFKTDHAEAGGRLLLKWSFPEHIAAAVAHHHAPQRGPKAHRRIAAWTYLANALAYKIGYGYGSPEYARHPDPETLRLVGLREEDLKTYEPEVQQALEREMAHFG